MTQRSKLVAYFLFCNLIILKANAHSGAADSSGCHDRRDEIFAVANRQIREARARAIAQANANGVLAPVSDPPEVSRIIREAERQTAASSHCHARTTSASSSEDEDQASPETGGLAAIGALVVLGTAYLIYDRLLKSESNNSYYEPDDKGSDIVFFVKYNESGLDVNMGHETPIQLNLESEQSSVQNSSILFGYRLRF